MSDSVRPHRPQPTRLPHPWDSPGKNTGVGCHFLLQCMKVNSLSRVRLLATPWTAAHQAPPSMGFSRQEYWSGVPLPSPKCQPSTPFSADQRLSRSLFPLSSAGHGAFMALVLCTSEAGHACCTHAPGLVIPDSLQTLGRNFLSVLIICGRRIGKTAYDGVPEVEMKVLNTDSKQKAEKTTLCCSLVIHTTNLLT